mmetsp:Transcript_50885/g.159489  ORF Transcript_50885/g.159489 Transcript_50885/m.159489 type:complete len:407 (+) Transcript_50885:62-1282(+)
MVGAPAARVVPATNGDHGSITAAIAEAEGILRKDAVQRLTPEELSQYRDQGYVVVRGVVPATLAKIIREQVIHPGFKHHGFDPEDPGTWGTPTEKLGMAAWFASRLVSETPYHGRWCNFGAGLDAEHRSELAADELERLRKVWQIANDVAALRLRATMDQLVGSGEWDDSSLLPADRQGGGGPLVTSLHVRYGLPLKDPRCRPESHRWPVLGWHIDGAWSDHLLGQRREQGGERKRVSDFCCVGIILYSDVLPQGGLTGVLPGSHKRIMRRLLASTPNGGISNARLLAGESIFNIFSTAVDPAADRAVQAGDALLMHPYLVHSSAWNFRPSLRLAARLGFQYRTPHDAASLLEMGRRQSNSVSELPPNTELFLHALQQESWKPDDWNSAPSPWAVRIEMKFGLRRG